MNRILFIVGKTRSGKDTIAKELCELVATLNQQMEPIVSYTTRPKRDNETNGVEHWFITKEEMDTIKKTQQMIAYTINEKTGIEYCATIQNTGQDKLYSYIINPNGLKWFLSHIDNIKDVWFRVLYVDCPENILKERGKDRNDDPNVFNLRLSSEREEFNDFRDNWSSLINYYIDTSTYEYESTYMIAYEIFVRFSADYNFYCNTEITLPPIVPNFKEGDSVILKKSKCSECEFNELYPDAVAEKILKVITLKNQLKEAFYVTERNPDTIIRDVDIVAEYYQYLKTI